MIRRVAWPVLLATLAITTLLVSCQPGTGANPAGSPTAGAASTPPATQAGSSTAGSASAPAATSPATSSSAPPAAAQVWELKTPMGDVARVVVSPFTNSGTFTETSDSPGWWMYDPSGNKSYRLHVGGNVSHAGGYDRWTFVGLSGSGGGWQTLGRGEGTTDRPFPGANVVSGTLTLTTQTPMGTNSPSGAWSGKRVSP